jgi:hypothetical protein
MSKQYHYVILGCIVIMCAAVSAFTVHRILTGTVMRNNDAVSSLLEPEQSLTPSIEVHFPKDQYGVYLLPTVDPTYPLRLGAQTVGGITACERLYNLRACLQKNKSPLISRLRTPEATAGAGLETVCGSVLNDIADIRPATTTIGCIW